MTEQEMEARRLSVKPYIENGTPHQEIAERFCVKNRMIRNWKIRFTWVGETALRVITTFHSPSLLTESQKEE